jgi:Flp pilus assembly protein TadG
VIGLIKNTHGGVLIFVASALPLVFLFIALVADIGMFHVARSQLQTMADAASLAGVSYSDDEIDIDQESRRSAPGGGTTVDVNVTLSERRADERAEAVYRANQAHLLRTIRLGETLFFLPAGGGDSVTYHVTIHRGETTWVFHRMEAPDANVYVAEISAQIETTLLGALFSAVFGEPWRSYLPVTVRSRSNFSHP